MENGGGAVNHDPRRALPSVDRLATSLVARDPELPDWAAIEGAREAVARARAQMNDAPSGNSVLSIKLEDLDEEAHRIARRLSSPHPQPVINATGIVLHTNLGRAPLARGAAEAAAEAAMRASSLEYDLESGRRGHRLGALDAKLQRLSGAEAGFACNNGAAAVLLGLTTLAAGREVIVSRGELVEIGGSFRIPEIMQRAGVRLVEVGATNRTHLRDYAAAIGPDTALLLKVHRSNFAQTGFVGEVSLAELVELGRERGLPVMEDLGSGTLVDLSRHGFPAESQVASRVALGADLVCFSGDKLMGGPQAGLALGRRSVIEAMKTDPLARALRLDVMTVAALDWTLGAMLRGEAERELPLLRQLLEPAEAIERRSREFAGRMNRAFGDSSSASRPQFEVMPGRAPVGGGSLPGFELDTWTVVVRGGPTPESLTGRLRRSSPPIIARIHDGAVEIDLRTVRDDELEALGTALMSALGS